MRNLIAVTLTALSLSAGASDAIVSFRVLPSATDPAIKRFDAPHVVMYSRLTRSQDLFVFLTGTGGQPEHVSALLEVAARAGYRVIGLSYDDEPAVAQLCNGQAQPACAERVRQKRIFGDAVTDLIDDVPAESVVNRLTKLLAHLAADRPQDGWAAYLSDGKPDWSRIAIAGHSQGGGMAAYIAKKKEVARVVTFSGGWDMYRPQPSAPKQLAPWYAQAPATPASRWYGAYHRREVAASAIADSFRLMGIPSDHVRIIERAPRSLRGNYHGSVIGNPANAGDWAFLIGNSR